MRTLALIFGVLAVALAAWAIPRDSANAYYGDPRFFSAQAPSRLLHNVAGDNFLVTSANGNITFIQSVTIAVTNWNDALRGSPNSITKYPLHYNAHADPNANIKVRLATTSEMVVCRDPVTGRIPPACNDGAVPTATIWIVDTLTGLEQRRYITHELGHSLWYTDQYYSDGSCSPANTVMNCASNVVDATDEVDFQTMYKPQLQSSDATYPETNTASWTVFYGGNTRLVAPAALVELNHVWDQYSDTTGGVTGTFWNASNDVDRDFGYVLTSRYCVTSRIYNEVGYSGGNGGAWSPRSQFSCIGAAQVQNAGFLLGTSDRTRPTSNRLYLRIKNFSGGTRSVAIFGPNFANIGCGYSNVSNGNLRTCSPTLARGTYGELTWFAFDTNNNVSWGYLDFE